MENFANDVVSNINQTMNEVNKSEYTIITPETLYPEIKLQKKKNNKKKNRQKKVEKIIQKWLILQKTIKEEITLEEVIIKQQNDDFDYLKDLFTQYYEKKNTVT